MSKNVKMVSIPESDILRLMETSEIANKALRKYLVVLPHETNTVNDQDAELVVHSSALQKYRKRCLMSINDICKQTGIDEAELNDLEIGREPSIKQSVLDRLAGVLGVPAGVLVVGETTADVLAFEESIANSEEEDNEAFEIVARRFALARARSGLTQRELAWEIGIRQATLSFIEHNRPKTIKALHLKKLAVLLKVDVGYLLGDGDEDLDVSEYQIANRIAYAHTLKNISQEEVADIIGIDKTTLGIWERGSTQAVRYFQLAQIARALGVPVKMITGRDLVDVSERLEKFMKQNGIWVNELSWTIDIPRTIVQEWIDDVAVPSENVISTIINRFKLPKNYFSETFK